MREVQWERMFPDELEAAFLKCPVVFYAYGLCEPHGPQNAIGLDCLKAHAIACETARSFGGIVAPPDYWHIHELGGYALWAEQNVGEVKRKWLTAVPPWVHFRNVCYHVRSADVLGFQAAIFLTGHYGPNWEDLKTVLELIQPYTKTRLYGLPDFEANQPGFDDDGKSGGDHAGKVETSLMWALDPACVDVSRIPDDAPNAPVLTPREGADAIDRPPYMAMGATAPSSDRRIGSRMVRDEVEWLSNKAKELLDQYDPSADVPGLATFDAVESFWDQEVKPRIRDFRSMAMDFGTGGKVDKSSVWHANWKSSSMKS